MFISKTLSKQGGTLPAYIKLRHAFFATCLIVGPFLMMVWLVFYPARTAVTASEVIAANMRIGPGMYLFSLLISVIELFLLPFGMLGMTLLAMKRAPWLASIGGFLALSGVMALIVFTGQNELSYLMAQMGGGQQLDTLWNQFNTDPLITVYLFIFITGYLIGPVLLAIALGRTHVIPAWAAWAIILRSPIQVAGFVTHIGLSIEIVTYGLLLIGSIPVALTIVKLSDVEQGV